MSRRCDFCKDILKRNHVCPKLFDFGKCYVCRIEIFVPKAINRYDLVKTCGTLCRSAYNKQLPARARKEFSRGHSQNRSRKIKAGDKIDSALVYELFNWICIVCDQPIDPDLKYPDEMCATLEHVIPLCKREGTHTWRNTAPAHSLCNSNKNNDMVQEIIEKAAAFWKSLI